MPGRFTVKRAADEGYRFQLEDDNRRIVFVSSRYGSRSGAASGLEALRDCATDDDRYERLITASGHTYFNVRSDDGEVIGTSVAFTSPQARLDAIAFMKQEAPRAALLDLT